jgi:hypothetical protein
MPRRRGIRHLSLHRLEPLAPVSHCRGDGRQELGGFERCRENPASSARFLSCSRANAVSAIAGTDRTGRAPELPHERIPVAARHSDVADDHVRCQPIERPKRLVGARRRHDIRAGIEENF